MKRITILVFLIFVLGLSSQLTAQQSESGSDLSKIIKTSEFTPGWAIGVKASTFGQLVSSFRWGFIQYDRIGD